jgi:hypothetical protein
VQTTRDADRVAALLFAQIHFSLVLLTPPNLERRHVVDSLLHTLTDDVVEVANHLGSSFLVVLHESKRVPQPFDPEDTMEMPKPI